MKKIGSFQKNLFLNVGFIFILMALCFSIYQYSREKEYKVEIMNSRMQMYAYEMMQTIGDSVYNTTAVSQYVSNHKIDNLRVTIINLKGKVLFDSSDPNAQSFSNHLQRPEIQQAIRNGNGYDSRRISESTHETYFYSATRFDNIIVRIAIPYSFELTESLKTDKTFIWYALVITLFLGFVLYRNTSRISKHIAYLREFAIKAENGEELHTETPKLPDDELGEISHIIITQYWKLRHAEDEKQRIKRQLTQNAAHELKTPANIIHGYLESILDNPTMSDEQKQHFLERCYAQSERMNKLLVDMSLLTKLDAASEEPTNVETTIDIIPIVKNAVEDSALQLGQKGIDVSLSIPETACITSRVVDPKETLYSIFRNLIDNVISYATGTETLSITINSTADNLYYQCSVVDHGDGVATEHLEHLFERFYRVDKGRSRKLGGTGLGLAIVKNAVIAHGGHISAKPTIGGGLTIQFTLQK